MQNSMLATETYNPLLVVPYLSQTRLQELQELGVSAVDLCGNGVISVPREGVLIWHWGESNQFPSSALIKNIYRKNSGIAARVFLLKARYTSHKEVFETIQDRGGQLTQATVSKVISSLQEDLIIEENRSTPTLKHRDGLIQKLKENFVPVDPLRTVRLRLNGTTVGAARVLTHAASAAPAIRIALAGPAAAAAYLSAPVAAHIDVYVENIADLVARLPGAAIDAPDWNVRLLQTTDDVVYFDRRRVDGMAVCSPIQALLELNQLPSQLTGTSAASLDRILSEKSK